MRHIRPRRFTLLDAMALIVAIAVGISITRSFGDFVNIRRSIGISFESNDHSPSNMAYRSATYSSDYIDRATATAFPPRSKGEMIYLARQLAFWPATCMAALSLATLGLGLGHALRLVRRPGLVMAVAVAVAMGAAAVRLPQLLSLKPNPLQLWRLWWSEFWVTVPRLAGFAVAVAWVTLALGGRWRAGGGWLDRLGVSLGATWIGMAMIDVGAAWFEALPF